MFTLADLQSFCDDLSRWIVELDEVEELQKAYPKGEFPLKVAEDDELDEGLDVLIYLTLWMCLKRKTKAPPVLESRILFSERLDTPWKELYVRLCNRLDQKKDFSSIFELAS